MSYSRPQAKRLPVDARTTREAVLGQMMLNHALAEGKVAKMPGLPTPSGKTKSRIDTLLAAFGTKDMSVREIAGALGWTIDSARYYAARGVSRGHLVMIGRSYNTVYRRV